MNSEGEVHRGISRREFLIGVGAAAALTGLGVNYRAQGAETSRPHTVIIPQIASDGSLTSNPEALKLPNNASFKPNRITVPNPNIPSFREGIELQPAQLDEYGEWVLPDTGEFFTYVHPENPNQLISFAHAKWNGELFAAGEFMLNAEIGETILLDGETNLIPDNQQIPGSETPLTSVEFTLRKLIASDDPFTKDLMNDKQNYSRPTFILITSLRVSERYGGEAGPYWVLDEELIRPKLTEIRGDLDNPTEYKHIIAVFEITDKGACTVVASYKNYTPPKGFMTPEEQCPK